MMTNDMKYSLLNYPHSRTINCLFSSLKSVFFFSRLEMERNSKISSEKEKKKADGDISLEEKADFESKKDDGKISLEKENKNTDGENQKEDEEDSAISDWDEQENSALSDWDEGGNFVHQFLCWKCEKIIGECDNLTDL